MLFYICKKLTSHQMLSSTEILKWLREILICRNKFLLKNKVCNIHFVTLLMRLFLWFEGVLVATVTLSVFWFPLREKCFVFCHLWENAVRCLWLEPLAEVRVRIQLHVLFYFPWKWFSKTSVISEEVMPYTYFPNTGETVCKRRERGRWLWENVLHWSCVHMCPRTHLLLSNTKRLFLSWTHFELYTC